MTRDELLKLIVEIDALAASATKRPWAIDPLKIGTPWNIDGEDQPVAMTMQIVGDKLFGQPKRTMNAKLIVALVNAWPILRDALTQNADDLAEAVTLMNRMRPHLHPQWKAEIDTVLGVKNPAPAPVEGVKP